MTVVNPRIKDILTRFEPITLPKEIPSLPLMLADILTAASGVEVPKATIVKPIIIGGILNIFASFDDPSTKRSAPLTSNTKPTISNK